MPPRHPNAPAPGDPIASHYRNCFGCGSEHPTGLHMQIFAGEGLSVVGEFEVTEHHQGAPGLAHGGLLAAAFDEVLGAANWLLCVPAVTARLEVDFKKPAPVGTIIHMDAQITAVDGRKVYTHSVGRLGDKDGPVILTAAALFIQVGIEHFEANGRAEDVERARADRNRGFGATMQVSP